MSRGKKQSANPQHGAPKKTASIGQPPSPPSSEIKVHDGSFGEPLRIGAVGIWLSRLHLFNYISAAFWDVFFLAFFILAAIFQDVHFHEVLLHAFFGAATFAVVRISEYLAKKNELKELLKDLTQVKDAELSKDFKALEIAYEGWQALFQFAYLISLLCWIVVALSVARAMRDFTDAMIKEVAAGNPPVHHRFTERAYWALPNGDPTLVWVAGVGASFSFVAALTLTVVCRRSEFRTDVKRFVHLFVSKLNYLG